MAELTAVEKKFWVEKDNLVVLGVEQFWNCHDHIRALNPWVVLRLEEIDPRREIFEVGNLIEVVTKDVIIQLK